MKMKLKIPSKLAVLFTNKHYRFRLAYGGRGGGKSWTFATFLILKSLQEHAIKILCSRETQVSITDSVYSLIKNLIYSFKLDTMFYFTRDTITCTRTQSVFIFKGLYGSTELRQSLKSLENIKYCWVEEAQTITKKSLDLLIPTIRIKNSEIWFSMNRQFDNDYVWYFITKQKEDKKRVVKINYTDNPFISSTLKNDAMDCKSTSIEDYNHIWEGHPQSQSSRALMDSNILHSVYYINNKATDTLEGEHYIGVDVARYGDDKTVFIERIGNTMIAIHEHSKKSITDITSLLLELCRNNTTYAIDDCGVGGGVVDILKKQGKKVIAINGASGVTEKEKYANYNSELWCTFTNNILQYKLLHHEKLHEELTTKLYTFDTMYRKKIESKETHKKRIGRSPDFADACIYCFTIIQKESSMISSFKFYNYDNE